MKQKLGIILGALTGIIILGLFNLDPINWLVTRTAAVQALEVFVNML